MKKILVVDDEALILTALSRALTSPRVEVMTAKTGGEALSMIRSDYYQLCFLDIHLPDCDGIDIMKTIKEISPETSVVVMSSKVLDRETKEAIEEQAHMYIPKPFELFHIKMIVKKLFDDTGSLPGDRA
ncbi:MAG: response regulator [Deltaproteobacteria bacterium]|nr:response regulator [Deltaproteobacteria bacterium]NIS76777.1 response regulator [Deltaproteobacteria bacterium]